MSPLRLLLVSGLLLLGGCLGPVREKTDQAAPNLASRPYDLVPKEALEDIQKDKEAPAAAPKVPLGGGAAPPGPGGSQAAPAPDIQTTAFLQGAPEKPAA